MASAARTPRKADAVDEVVGEVVVEVDIVLRYLIENQWEKSKTDQLKDVDVNAICW